MNDANKIKFAPYDLKSKATKYKRWTPKMDLFFVKLLSDVVHSYPKDQKPELNKKGWAYVCNHLRLANPQTVYSTYTKYSCSQHLYNVIHSRYKLWYSLMVHSTSTNGNDAYSFKWNPNTGSFQIIVVSDNQVITDEGIIKSIIYGESLPLPPLDKFHKGNIVVNDFFLSTNYSYMSDYHNEILPMLMELDPIYAEGLEDVYHVLPKFEYHGFNRGYSKPLSIIRPKKGVNSDVPEDYAGDLGLDLHEDFSDGYFPDQPQHQPHPASSGHHSPAQVHQGQVSQGHQNQLHPSQSPTISCQISDQISSSISSQMSSHMTGPVRTEPLKKPLHHIQTISGSGHNLASSPGHESSHLHPQQHTQHAQQQHRHPQQLQQQQNHQHQNQQQQHQNQIQQVHHRLQNQHQGLPPPQINQSHQISEINMEPSLKRARILSNDFDGEMSATVIGDFASGPPTAVSHPASGHTSDGPGQPDAQAYQKDRPWFNKLMSLHENNLITIGDFFTVLEGVRDNKFPAPLLNILDPGAQTNKFTDEEIAKRTRMYIIPMCESFKSQ